ncbi:transposase [Streptomyces laurentii]|uniref:transposase n=1 Tax=Streptomyces laurentii TaxID=39478 RepID=UPI0036A4B765
MAVGRGVLGVRIAGTSPMPAGRWSSRCSSPDGPPGRGPGPRRLPDQCDPARRRRRDRCGGGAAKEKGFQSLPKRWVIERTFGRLMRHRRLARDDEALPQKSRTVIHWTMAARMSRELTGASAPTWRIETYTPPTPA